MEKSKQLSVDSYHLEEINVTRNPDFEATDDSIELDVATEFSTFTHASDEARFAVSLCVKSQEPLGSHQAFRFSVRITGFFRVAEPIVDRKLHGDRVVNGLTILYGIVRGYVGTATAWFNEPLILPTVYFSDLVNAKIEAARNREVEPHHTPLIASQ